MVSSGPTLKEQGMEVSWAGGSEPPILAWLRDRGELGGNLKRSTPSAAPVVGGKEGRADESQAAKFSTFVCFFLIATVRPCSRCLFQQPSTFPASPPPEPAKSTNTLDFESLTLLRLREAERARLEREILEAEARGES